jgi:hypothetical protein
VLSSRHIPIEAVSDYHRYPIADNDMPMLSCDRLEYTLGNAVNYRFITPAKAREFLADLCVFKNGQGETELAFRTQALAEEFAWNALRCGKIYSGREDRYSMERLARLLKQAVADGILEMTDLYTTEAEVIATLENSPLREAWTAFTKLSEVVEASGPEDGIQVDAKRRYIDPLSCGGKRVSETDPAFAEAVQEFIHEDYSVYLKGN